MPNQSTGTFTAIQLMTRPVETVKASDTLSVVSRLFTDRSISAAGVLDNHGKFVGAITKTDLIRDVIGIVSSFDLLWVLASENGNEVRKP